jgi:hypothetical protein
MIRILGKCLCNGSFCSNLIFRQTLKTEGLKLPQFTTETTEGLNKEIDCFSQFFFFKNTHAFVVI